MITFTRIRNARFLYGSPMFRHLPRSRVSRALSIALVGGQVLTAIPVVAAPAAASAPAAAVVPSSPPPPPPQVTVNRTVPSVTPPPLEPQFSDAPTVEEIVRARVFPEPLVPVGGEPSAGENLVLAQALLAFHRSGGLAWESTLGPFLLAHPSSTWRASLLANLGVVQLHAHAYSRALASFNEAWVLAMDATDAKGRAVADGAVAEWLTLAASLGQIDAAEARLRAIRGRSMTGSAGAKVTMAREAVGLIRRHPEKTIPCGPAALLALLASQHAGEPAVLTGYVATAAGTSLTELADLAQRAGLSLQPASRESATEIPVPAVVHLKVGHYIAVTEHVGDRYRVRDRSLAESYWISRDTLLDESSGYALIPSGALPDGWRSVGAPEGDAIIGRGPACPDGSPPPPPSPSCDCRKGNCCGQKGMADYRLEELTASLLLSDQPLAYTPPRGPAIPLALVYYHRESLQPQIFSFSNLGPKWTFGWTRFIQEVPTDGLGVTPPHVSVSLPPSREVFSNPDAQGVYPAHWNSRSVLVRVSDSPVRYERRLPDGTVEVYTWSDGAPAGQRRVMLTQFIDPQGQSLQLTWDSQTRLVAMTDAIGQVTTFAYEHGTDPLKITKITDPFGRAATFTYNAAGQLASITDVIGLTSKFAYGPDDFVNSLTTPYGVTTFRHESNPANSLNVRFIEATDPLGATEHVEFQWETPSLPASLAAGDVPTGFGGWNLNLDHYNTFYWNKRAWAAGPNDLSKAQITHWLVKAEWEGWQKYSFVPHSVKKPLEARVWYAYPGQVAGNEDELGWWRQPSRVGRVLDDGTSQIYETTYNTQGSVVTRTDPLGRQTSYTYASNGVDLLEVRQTTGGMNDLLASYANYTAQHEAQSVTDAAGQATNLTYNAAGQVLTLTNANNETTTWAYDPDGELTNTTGPIAGATTTYTYDGYKRLRTVTDADGYTVTADYDIFDRLSRVTYPSGAYEQTTYDRLDVSARQDKAGQITRYYYDPLRRLISTRDPAGRIVAQQWCACGGLDAVVDANGNRTRFERDLEGRLAREIRADSVTARSYSYGTNTGRLSSVTDAKAQVRSYSYASDNALLSLTFANAEIATPGVSYTYDAQYGRLMTMTDGTGPTTYTYYPQGQLGAGRLATIDGPIADDTISYTYDQLGRVATRLINGIGVTRTFNALGLVTTELTPLGAFSYAYDGHSSRLESATYPNGQTSTYTYLDNAHDRRLETIHHKYPTGATLSRFDYSYDIRGNVLTWRQQADSAAVMWAFGYDFANQLTWAVKKTTDPVPTILQTFAYGYDSAGNRTSEQIDDQLTGALFDPLNRLTTQHPSGAMTVQGLVSEPSAVSVQSKPVVVSLDGQFSATVPVVEGTSVLNVTAKDPSGNLTSNTYEVDSTGPIKTFAYDANGNLTSDGMRTFEWDARDQLVAVNNGIHRSEFSYDGARRRVETVEKTNGTTDSVVKAVWCGVALCEERDADGGVIRRRFSDADQVVGGSNMLTRDHLGTIREISNAQGLVEARYTYDPWGRRTVVAGADESALGFTGHQWHSSSSLWLTQFRAYDPTIGRWLSEDPQGFMDGPNLYAYVANQPTQVIDPFGLQGLYVEGPPPSDAPPPGCEANGPWKMVSHGRESIRERRTWRRGPDTVIPIASGGSAVNGKGDPQDSLLPFCFCNWTRVGRESVITTYEEFTRPIWCCDSGDRTQTARTRLEGTRPLGYLDDGHSQYFSSAGIMGGDGKCQCRQGPPE